jgi:hypothetical protein
MVKLKDVLYMFQMLQGIVCILHITILQVAICILQFTMCM